MESRTGTITGLTRLPLVLARFTVLSGVAFLAVSQSRLRAISTRVLYVVGALSNLTTVDI